MEPMKQIFVKPMKRINYYPTVGQLKYRAKKHGMTIRKYRRGAEDEYMLIDIRLNVVAAPAPMTLAQIELWLDDLDNQAFN